MIDAPNAVQAHKLAQEYRVIGGGLGWRAIGKKGDSMRFEKHRATLIVGKPRRMTSTRDVAAK